MSGGRPPRDDADLMWRQPPVAQPPQPPRPPLPGRAPAPASAARPPTPGAARVEPGGRVESGTRSDRPARPEPTPRPITPTATLRVSPPGRHLRVVAGSLLGAALLVLAQWLGPAAGAPFGVPTGGRAIAGAVCGVLGVLLVPGLWISVVLRAERGFGPRLTAWVGGTLAWHTLLALAAHAAVPGAKPTTGVVLGLTVGGTLAACGGLLLAPAWPPVWERAQLGVPVGAGLALVALPLLRWRLGLAKDISGPGFEVFTLVFGGVLGAAGATATRSTRAPRSSGGAHGPRHGGRPPGPASRVLAALAAAVVAVGVVTLVAHDRPTTQHQPPALTAQQSQPPPGVDLAVTLGAAGAPVNALADAAAFGLYDPAGGRVSASVELVRSAGSPVLFVTLAPASRSLLCRQLPVAVGDMPLVLRDATSGLRLAVRLQVATSCPVATGTVTPPGLRAPPPASASPTPSTRSQRSR